MPDEIAVQETSARTAVDASSRRLVRTEPPAATLRDILGRPRTGLRMACANAIRRVRRHGWTWLALGLGLFALQMGIFLMQGEARPAIVHLAVFAGVFLSPLLLAYAWPVIAGAFVIASVWIVWVLGAGGLWFMLATACASFFLYLSAGGLAPFMGAAALGLLASAAGAAAGWTAFALSLPILFWARLRVSAPIMAGLWAWVACDLAGRAAMTQAAVPLEWPRRSLIFWTTCAMILAGALVWPSPRRRPRSETALGPQDA